MGKNGEPMVTIAIGLVSGEIWPMYDKPSVEETISNRREAARGIFFQTVSLEETILGGGHVKCTK